MKNTFTRLQATALLVLVLTAGFYTGSAQCVNADFEDGDFTGWTGTWGAGVCSDFQFGICLSCYTNNPTQNAGLSIGPLNAGPDYPNNYHFIMNSGYDANLAFVGRQLPVVYPGGGTYSACLGSIEPAVGSEPASATLSYTFVVTPANQIYTYHYALVLSDGGHVPQEQAYFSVTAKTSRNVAIRCGSDTINASTAAATPGFDSVHDQYAELVRYCGWRTGAIPLSDYLGDTVTVTFTTNSCEPTGCAGTHYAYAYLDGSCLKPTIAVITDTGCRSRGPALTAPDGSALYNWTGPGITSAPNAQTITVNRTGRYTVTMTGADSTSCSYSLDTAIIVDSVFLYPDFSANQVCVGNATTFTDLSTPATAHINTWNWNFGDAGTSTDQNPTHTYAQAGTFTVSLSISSTTCTVDTTISVVVVPLPTSAFTATSPVCKNDSSVILYTGNAQDTAIYTWTFDGGIATPGTGNHPGTVKWSGTGTKNITLTVQEGVCTSTVTTIPVTINAPPVITITTDTTICNGSSITLTAAGATTYQWAANASLSATTGASVTASPTVSDSYTVTGTTNGCTAQASVSVGVSGVTPLSSFIVLQPTVCTNVSTLILYNGGPQTGYTYLWSVDGGLGTDTGGAISINWATEGTKTVSLVVKNGSCVSNATSQQVTVNASPVISFTPYNPVVCGPGNNINITVSGADTYQWASNPTLSGSGASVVVSPTQTTTYVVTGTNSTNHCTTRANNMVIVAGAPGNQFTVTATSCTGDSATVAYTGNASGVTFNWNFDGGSAVPASGSGPFKVTWLTPGTKHIILQANNGICATYPDTVAVTLYTKPVLTLTPDTAICSGSSVALSATGATTYLWQPDSGLNVTNTATVLATPVSTTQYFVTGTNGNCSVRDSATVFVSSSPTSGFTVLSPACLNSGTTVTYTGNAPALATYNWGFDGGTATPSGGQGPLDITWPTVGTKNISLTVTVGSCISAPTTVPVQVVPSPVLSVTADTTICAGDTVTLTASGATSYQWAPGISLSSVNTASVIATPVTDIRYVVIGTTGNCTATDSVNVTVTQVPTPFFTATSPICAGDTAVITYTGTGAVGDTYVWIIDGGTIASGSSQGPYHVYWTTPGTKDITLSVQAGNCISTPHLVPVIVNAIPTATFTATSPLCAGQTGAVTYTGNADMAAEYNWNFAGGSNSAGTDAGPYNLSWSAAGTYVVTLHVTNNGCHSDTDSVAVTVKPLPVLSLGNDTAVCSGDTVIVGGLSTQGYTYTWSPHAGLSSDTVANPVVILNSPLDSAVSFNYTVTAIYNGCSSSDSVRLTVNPVPVLSVNQPAPQCLQGDTFTFTAQGNFLQQAAFTWYFDGGIASDSTGAGPIRVSWDSAGRHTVALAVQQLGCTATFTDTVTVSECLGIETLSTDGISIYPNPAKNDFTITINQSIETGSIDMFDVLGQRIYTSPVEHATAGTTQQVHVNVATGVYFVVLSNGSKQLVKKLVVE